MGERFNKFKENCERKKRELYWKIHDTKEWVRNHPVESVWILSIGTGVVSAGVNGGIKLADRIKDAREERDEKCSVWDPVNGIHWYTKKPMTASQKLEFERRVSNGEDRGKVLDNMNVLRR